MCTPMSEARVRERRSETALSGRRKRKHNANRIPANMLKICSSKH